jgi:hypothetical protein
MLRQPALHRGSSVFEVDAETRRFSLSTLVLFENCELQANSSAFRHHETLANAFA